MKAIVYSQYGPPEVLKPVELPKPQPREDEILIRIRAVAINYGDLIARNFAHLPKSQF